MAIIRRRRLLAVDRWWCDTHNWSMLRVITVGLHTYSYSTSAICRKRYWRKIGCCTLYCVLVTCSRRARQLVEFVSMFVPWLVHQHACKRAQGKTSSDAARTMWPVAYRTSISHMNVNTEVIDSQQWHYMTMLIVSLPLQYHGKHLQLFSLKFGQCQ